MSWWNKAKSAVKGVGNVAYDITGADNYMNAVRRARQGNFMGALGSLGTGALETAFLAAPGFGAGSAVGRGLAKSAGGRALSAVTGAGARQPLRRFVGNTAAAGGLAYAIPKVLGTPATPAMAATQQQGVLGGVNVGPAALAAMSGVSPAAKPAAGVVNTSKKWAVGQTKKGKGDYDVRWDGKKWNIIPGTQGKYSQPAAAATPAATAPTPVVETGAPTSVPAELPSLSPEEAAMFAGERTQAESGFRSLLSQLAAERAGRSTDIQEGLRGIGRQEAGQAADFAAMAGETGLGLSPAIAGAARQQIGQQASAARRRVGSTWAQTLAGLGQQQLAGETARNMAFEAARRREAAARAARSQQNIASIYGGLMS